MAKRLARVILADRVNGLDVPSRLHSRALMLQRQTAGHTMVVLQGAPQASRTLRAPPSPPRAWVPGGSQAPRKRLRWSYKAPKPHVPSGAPASPRRRKQGTQAAPAQRGAGGTTPAWSRPAPGQSRGAATPWPARPTRPRSSAVSSAAPCPAAGGSSAWCPGAACAGTCILP